MASTKACDEVFHVEPPSAAKKLRELFYCAHFIHSHIAHFYVLAAPDFVVGPQASPFERNILGVVAKVGADIGKEVIKHRAYAQDIQAVIGGKATHPVCGLPGGMSRPLTEEERKSIEEKARSCVEFAKFTLKIFDDVVLKNKEYVDLIHSDIYGFDCYSMGLVDEYGRLNFYDGEIRVCDTKGNKVAQFAPKDYLDYISEHVESWSYLKYPYLKKIGWKGLVGGNDSGVYRVGPLARLNVTDEMTTPIAQENFERMFSVLNGKPVHATLATHWARVIELAYAAERVLELSKDSEITSRDIRVIPKETPTEGVGCVEAPRGTLIHHYVTDADGITREVNLLVATVHNNAPISISVKQAAKGLIKKGDVKEGILNMVEMAFRAYDPCFGCATHSLPGEMPLRIDIFNAKGELLQRLQRD
jgi:F420-non-reducing hydrogenase large subunit